MLSMMSDGTAMVRVTQGGAPVIAKQIGFSITAGVPYTAQVEMRADLPNNVSRNVYWDIKQDVNPWNTETSRNVSVTNQWQTFSMSMTAPFAMSGIGRMGLSVENLDAPIYIRNAEIGRAGHRGLTVNESLEAGNVSLVGGDEVATEARVNDYLLFLAAQDRSHLDQMLGAIREKTDALVPVAGTQMGYGGLLNYDSHADLDYQEDRKSTRLNSSHT